MSPKPIVPSADDEVAGSQSTALTAALATALVGWMALAIVLLLDSDPDPVWTAVEDIFGHALLFFVGGALARAMVLDGAVPGGRFIDLIAGFTMVVATELAQEISPSGRAGEVSDVLAGSIGVIGGALAVTGLAAVVGSRRTKMMVAAAGWLTVTTAVVVAIVNTPPEPASTERCREVPTPTLRPGPGDVEPGPAFRLADGIRDVAGVSPARIAPVGPVVTSIPDGMICGAIAENGFTIVATVASADLAQSGPTRIVSLASGTRADDINTHLGQEGRSASLRVRVGEETLENVLVPGVFTDTGSHTLVFRFHDGDVELFRDGELVDSFETVHDDIAGWRGDVSLNLGNEATGDRPFDGTIDAASFYQRALTDDEVAVVSGP
ncbi:MAG: LamG-like jellyroll fold domain-containing protein [Acidimicrobiales bacterium]